VLSRFLARLVTGPLAFLAAGALDMAGAWSAWGAAELRARLRRLRTPGTRHRAG
jgi:hypothetical protein